MGKIKKRAGFTLIEVIVALGIFLIVVLALLSGYAFYYKSVRDLRYQTVGENLTQLQLEDLRNIGIASLGSILRDGARFPMSYDCPNYPPTELFYNSDGTIEWLSYNRPEITKQIGKGVLDGSDNLPNWANLPVVELIPSEPELGELKKNLASVTYNEDNNAVIYDSGKRDSDFIVEGLTSVPSDPVLPGSIIVAPSANQIGKYDLIIEKWTFPLYKKEIKIEDLNPEIPKEQLTKKLYMVSVTVFWTVNGIEKSVTVNQEVGFEGQEP
jgi:prepilin-type N-terminal cleavage/methylation domain-containing protein